MELKNGYKPELPAVVTVLRTIIVGPDGRETVGEVRIQPNVRKAIK